MKKKLCLLLALLLVISVPLTACGGNDKPTDQPAEQTPGEETPDPDVKYILNLGVTSFPTNTNPFSQRMQQDHNGLRMYETLVNHDAKTLEFVGQLAESWTVSEDGQGFARYQPRLPRFREELGQLDVSTSYRIAKGLTVFLQARDVLEEPRRIFVGDNTLVRWEDSGILYRFGVRWQKRFQ